VLSQNVAGDILILNENAQKTEKGPCERRKEKALEDYCRELEKMRPHLAMMASVTHFRFWDFGCWVWGLG